ncbi:MAG TPA: hypothetical protein PKI41_13700 [Candidatus Competibacteraceae bacterium]|nr:MAG: hypothetical protein EKK71_03535 [Candidatus Competibacteraceae bacterium]HOB63155.1 hypothetical protein [Candidatus Competibacteraceae bacterium]HQA27037.1 hypothetical protein [Candidatus Competibacteraceae bacterium]HQD57555.1 hypothetical protein [Candidatus Competibacteraceae bacterium]
MYKRYGMLRFLTALLFAVPLWICAQQASAQNATEPGYGGGYGGGYDERRWLQPPDPSMQRGYVRVTNDWRDTVKLTMWTKRGTQIGSYWALRPGESSYLLESGQRITARPEYNIRVGDDWGSVELGRVGRFYNNRWQVNVRDIWRATHTGRNPQGWDNSYQ